MKRKPLLITIVILCLFFSFGIGGLVGYYIHSHQKEKSMEVLSEARESDRENAQKIELKIDQEEATPFIFDLSSIPEYQGEPYVELNHNIPLFSDEQKQDLDSFEFDSSLDDFGRCGVTFANVCKELMPLEERGEIGQIKPSGWHTVKYNEIIDGNYLYNRCHLIAYQLAGENDNELNLITGTRYLNVCGMLPFENLVSEYINQTENHVLYRVTPIFEKDNLVASGVQMEAWSVEDEGKGICFHIYCYNVQPGIEIDYKTGDSFSKMLSENKIDKSNEQVENQMETFILNTRSNKIHKLDCESVSEIAEHNKKAYEGTLELLMEQNYSPCHRCFSDYYGE